MTWLKTEIAKGNESDSSEFDEMDSDNYYSESESENEVEIVEEKEHPKESVFEELSQSDILESAKSEVQHFISNADGVSEAEARRLLQNNEWDLQTAFGALTIEIKEKTEGKDLPVQTDSSTLECEVCMDDLCQDDVANLACNHVFCKGCLKDSILENINNRIVDIKCPGENCEQLLSFDDILYVLADEELKSKFLRLFSQSYVDNNKNTAWCPGTDCEIAFRCKEFHNNYNVECSKGHKSCFNCQGTWHDPLDCDMLKKWLKKCQDDSETANWISANTKECPKCYAQIEKNGGCNHMTCSKCKYEMCWLCMKKWSGTEHGCKPVEERSDISDRRRALNRYLGYHRFYAGHKKSLEIESKITIESVYERYEKPQKDKEDEKERKKQKNKEIIEKEEETEEGNDKPATFFQRGIIKQACDVLKECRNTLMYSYVFAFYLRDKTTTKDIFESNQGTLQNKVERLSAFLEREVHKLNDYRTMKEMEATVRFCEDLSKQLVDYVKEQRNMNTWQYINV